MEGSSHSLLQGIVLMRTPFFQDMTMYQLVAGPNVLKQCSGFKPLGSNNTAPYYRRTESSATPLQKPHYYPLLPGHMEGKPSVSTASFLPEI
jgi:hypothetical protein